MNVRLLASLWLVVTSTSDLRRAKDVEIVGFDYAFKVPATMPAGPTTLRFRNDGKHAHELNVVQLKSGASLKQFIDAANAGKPLSPMIERVVGVLFAGIFSRRKSLI